MPKKGKSPNKRNQSRRNKSNKSNKSNKNKSTSSNKQNDSNYYHKRKGRAFSKEILQILGQLTSVLREVDQLKGSPLYETAIKLDEIVDKIIKLQSGYNNHQDDIWGFESVKNIKDEQILLNRLSLWIKSEQNDSFINDKYEFKTGLTEGRGVVAKKDLNKDELCMAIHRKLMITHSYVINKSDDKIRRFLKKDPLCNKIPSLSLVLFVWYERLKGNKSYFKPYLDALPKSFNLPHECKIKDLIPFLRGSLILEKIIRLKISHLRHYTYSRQMLNRAGIEPGLRLIDYLWSAGVVMTRQNKIPKQDNDDNDNDVNKEDDEKGPETEIALIPGWDMSNYKGGQITTYFNTKKQKNEMYLMNDVKCGEQIYIYYGQQRNELLYLNSGFVFNDNPNDEIELDLTLNMKDALYKIKSIVIKNAKLTNPIKALIPILNYKQYQQTKFMFNKEKEEEEEEEEEKKTDDEKQVFDENDISTKWMLSVYDNLGLSIPAMGIQFARIASMNRDEVMSSMQVFLEKQKKIKEKNDENQTNENENNNDNKLVEKDDKNNKNENEDEEDDDDNGVKQVISIENEIKSWNLLYNKLEILYNFFTKTLKECINVHCKNEMKEKEIDCAQIIKKLRKQKKGHVALAFELLYIERRHYEDAMEVLKKGLDIIEERLRRVLNTNK